jgi:hypothetical protein
MEAFLEKLIPYFKHLFDLRKYKEKYLLTGCTLRIVSCGALL